MPYKVDQFILFGDSITEYSADQIRGFGFAPALENAYSRRLDVINRGLSGYNTEQGLKVLSDIIPPPEQANVRFMTIFFGANDARLPNDTPTPQTIPLEQYKQNLKKIVNHPSVQAHKPRIILITPPPVEETALEQTDHSWGNRDLTRTVENTSQYAQAVRDVGKELNVPVLDLWNAFMTKAGWKEGQPLPGSKATKSEFLQGLMHDGLHFNPEAYRILYEELMKVIEKTWPDQMPEELDYVLPRWDDVKAWQS